MGTRTEKSGVTPKGDRIQITFRWKGEKLRPTLNLKPTAANLKHALRLRENIIEDIQAGTFNIREYFPDYRFIDKLDAPADVQGRTFKDWADVWAQLSARTLEDSTLRIYKRHLTAYWVSKFGDLHPKKITHEMLLKHLTQLSTDHLDEGKGRVVKGLARKTQNNIIIPLRGVFSLICKSDKTITDPTEGIDNLKIQKPEPDPFTSEEVESILAKAKERFGAEVADYFEFSIFAGLRPSEQISLLWEDVDLRAGTLKVRRARVLGKDKERTKTTYERVVELNNRAWGVAERQRARTQLKGAHVFINPDTGRPWHDEQAQRKKWVTVLKLAGVRYRPPKECRDTSVTLALMSGADPIWVAAQHGHSLMVMMKDYAKWIPKADRGRNLAAVNRAMDLPDAASGH